MNNEVSAIPLPANRNSLVKRLFLTFESGLPPDVSSAFGHSMGPHVLPIKLPATSPTPLTEVIEMVTSLRKVHNKLASVGVLFHSLTSVSFKLSDSQEITQGSLLENEYHLSLLSAIAALVKESIPVGSVDFFSTQDIVPNPIWRACLTQLMGVTVNFVSQNSDIVDKPINSLVLMYFSDGKIPRINSAESQKVQQLAGFEKIRTVGKGAYGTAVLYRKKDDNSLVILKEINLHDLNATERQLALNEVKVLSMLDHPNVISYFDNFEEDGILMIEMDYADGGNLAQYLSSLGDDEMAEFHILSMFRQMVAAIKYIHEQNVLHRDLKTANIFLTKEGVVKIGDFGISKLLSTANQGAQTVLGTPYYISPEMCEGKAYNDRSDIWALGCILYEMACRQRTFEGSNLPALVNKIMKGQFQPVKGDYSDGFKNLIEKLLQKEPTSRPSAAELSQEILPKLMSRNEHFPENEVARNHQQATRSVLYFLEIASMSLSAVNLDASIQIQSVAVGSGHIVVVTTEHLVYSWGEGSSGQLGHGDFSSQQRPLVVDALKEKNIVKAVCGDGFSAFLSDNGLVMTCGQSPFGCTAHGGSGDIKLAKPKLVETLLSVDVTSIACGPNHVVVVGLDGSVYSWGCGSMGQLGHGSDENVLLPRKVEIAQRTKKVFCGPDSTMLLTSEDGIFATGSNEFNKLGLNQRQGFLKTMKNIFTKTEVERQHEFTFVRVLTNHVVSSISLGQHHSAVLTDKGRLILFGRNDNGQLGNGTTRAEPSSVDLSLFHANPASCVECGEGFTVAGTLRNEIYIWGLYQQEEGGGPHRRALSSVSGKSTLEEVLLEPTALLSLDSQGLHSPAGEKVSLTSFFCWGRDLYIQVETTAPTPRHPRAARKQRKPYRRSVCDRKSRMSASSEGGDEYSSGTSELNSSEDTLGKIPAWIQQELANSAEEDAAVRHENPSQSTLRGKNCPVRNNDEDSSCATPVPLSSSGETTGSVDAATAAQENEISSLKSELERLGREKLKAEGKLKSLHEKFSQKMEKNKEKAMVREHRLLEEIHTLRQEVQAKDEFLQNDFLQKRRAEQADKEAASTGLGSKICSLQ